MNYTVLPLSEVLEMDGGEQFFSELAAAFSCPLNTDIEDFLRRNAVDFQRRSLTRTYFVFADEISAERLTGYYSVAMKPLDVIEGISKTLKKEITGAGSDVSAVSVFLIGQLAKNSGGVSMPGKKLLELALERLEDAREIVGGRIALVECVDVPELHRFYTGIGFKRYRKDADGLVQYIMKIS